MSAVDVLAPVDPLAGQNDKDYPEVLNEASVSCPDVDMLLASGGEEELAPLTMSKENTMIIFDWDDTLVPTTYLFSSHPGSLVESFEMPFTLKETLDACAVSALATLESAKQCGHVVIITNSETGWIDLATQRFFPLLTEVLSDVPKLSARSAFESADAAMPVHWKVRAFEQAIENFYGTTTRLRNIVAVGDADHDRAAFFLATERLPAVFAKSLKLTEQPDAEYIVKEQELIRESMPMLATHEGMLDLCIHCHMRSSPGLDGAEETLEPAA